jgi:hypothetical protein
MASLSSFWSALWYAVNPSVLWFRQYLAPAPELSPVPSNSACDPWNARCLLTESLPGWELSLESS